MLDDFILFALAAGLGVSFAVGPLGCFVLWRRMAYFGDATAHAALLGVTLAVAFHFSIYIGVIFVALAIAFAVSSLSERNFGSDAVLGVASHSALAFGLVGASFLPNQRLDLHALLFGDILAVSSNDLFVILIGSACILALLYWRWQSMITATLNPELASASGINPRFEQHILNITLALLVAIAIKIIGALLIASLLIIPAAAARPLSRTPESMAFLAIGVSAISILAGLGASLTWDTPTGPSIVCAAAVIFALANVVTWKRP